MPPRQLIGLKPGFRQRVKRRSLALKLLLGLALVLLPCTSLAGANCSFMATKNPPCDGLSILHIYSLLNVDLDTQTQCQKLWRKDPFGVETSAFAEENLGRANFGNPIEGISKLNSSDIDLTASKIIKPATPTITIANRMVLRSMRKLLGTQLKPQ